MPKEGIDKLVRQVRGLQSRVHKGLQLWDSRAAPARISGCCANRWQVTCSQGTTWELLLVECLRLKTEVWMHVCGGGERSGSVASIGSVRSSSSLQNSGNTHVLTTPAPSPHPANTAGVNTHGLNAPGLHAQSEGVKVRDALHFSHISAGGYLETSAYEGNHNFVSCKCYSSVGKSSIAFYLIFDELCFFVIVLEIHYKKFL